MVSTFHQSLFTTHHSRSSDASSGTGAPSHLAVELLAIPDIRDRLSAQGMDPSSMTPQAFSAYIDSEIGKWTRIIKAAHVKAD
jgi:hypothetical protein